MVANIAYIIVGLIILLFAGDVLVRGAVNLASMLKIPTLLIGLTIVAFGTSAPEFVVTLGAVSSGDNAIAIGNIIGSNTANILLVLGLPAVIAPIAMTLIGVRRHASVMLIATAVFAWFCYINGEINFTAGIILMAMIAIYIVYIGFRALTSQDEPDPILDEIDEFHEGQGSKWKTPLFIIAGLIGLPFGAGLLIENGEMLASSLGVRQELIGLTIVAFGTSLPELATVITAALKRHADVAVGNIVGSNIFNLLFVGGTAGLAGGHVNPSPITTETQMIDLPVMIAATIVLAILIYIRGTISRILGFAMFLAYLAYIFYIGMAA
ncbi:MAG: calcium/sodium antiporter [bacterium]